VIARVSGRKRIDVVVPSYRYNDGISFDALVCRNALRDLGFESDLYADFEHSAPEVRDIARPHTDLAKKGNAPDAILYHYSTLSPTTELLRQTRIPLLLRYHNITPPQFFEDFSPQTAARLEQAREELVTLREQTVLGVCPSRYNCLELERYGFSRTAVVPNFCRLHSPVDWSPPKESVRILFVGRLVPNKCQHELVKVASLLTEEFDIPTEVVLAGNTGDCSPYASLVRSLAQSSPARVFIAGEFPQDENVYRGSHIYLSLSEHEGFGMPLVEAMACGVPVIAYAAAAVPEVVDTGGLLFSPKNLVEVAALIHSLVAHPSRLSALRRAGLERARVFSHENIKKTLVEVLRTVGLESKSHYE